MELLKFSSADVKKAVGVLKAEKDDPEGFQEWRKNLEAEMEMNEAWGYIKGTIPTPTPSSDNWNTYQKNLKRVFFTLKILISNPILEKMALKESSTPKEMWEWLENEYRDNSEGGKRAALMEWLNIRMRAGETLVAFSKRFTNLKRAHERNLSSPLDATVVFQQYLTAIRKLHPTVYLRFVDVDHNDIQKIENAIRSDEILDGITELSVTDANPPAQVFVAFGGNCFQCGRGGHVKADCRSPPKCYGCQQFGHEQRDCPGVGGNQGGGRGGGGGRGRGRGRGGRWNRGGMRGGRSGGSANAADGRGVADVMYGDEIDGDEACAGSRGAQFARSKNGGGGSPAVGPREVRSQSDFQPARPMEDGIQVLLSSAIRESSALGGTQPLMSSRVLIDTGASHSICPTREMFMDFTPGHMNIDFAGFGRNSVSEGTGTIDISMVHTLKVVSVRIRDVIYNPTNRFTLISGGSMQDAGISIFCPGYSNQCILKNLQDEILCVGLRCGMSLYDMPISVKRPVVSANALSLPAVTKSHGLAALWHLRMGHLNVKTVAKLAKQNYFPGVEELSEAHDISCLGCALGKTHVTPNSKPNRVPVSNPGGRIHMDIWGPSPVEGLERYRYLLVIVDEGTNVFRVTPLRAKSNAAASVRDYVTEMEKQYSNFEVKIARSDNAREILLSNEMQEWLRERGIRIETSPPYTSSSNGKAERAIRTIMDGTRSILEMSGMPKFLWPEIAQAVAYLRNRSPSSAIGGKIPIELLTGKRAFFDHLHILGCRVVVFDKQPGRSKLDARGNVCRLIGYGVDSTVYRLWDPTRKKVIVSRDVQFLEEAYLREHYLPFFGDKSMALPVDKHASIPAPCEVMAEQDATGGGDDNDDDDDSSLQPWAAPVNMVPQESPIRDSPVVGRYRRESRGPQDFPDLPKRDRPQKLLRALSKIKEEVEEESMESGGALSRGVVHTPRSVSSSSAGLHDRTSRLAPFTSDVGHDRDSESEDELTRRDGNVQPPDDAGDKSIYYDPEDSPDPLVGINMVIVDTTERIEAPKTFSEAMASPWAAKWLEACQEEINALEANQTWELIDNPGDHPVLTGKWVFAVKIMSPSQVRFKARWCARGFHQQHGIDYNETFAPVMNSKSWHILLALAAAEGLVTRNYDVSNAFLNGTLSEKVFLEQPHGFVNDRNKICALMKSLYGLKQAANSWFEKMRDVLTTKMGFKHIHSDSVVFVRGSDGTRVIVGGHVDDLLTVARTEAILDAFGKELSGHLKIKEGDMELFLGVEIIRNAETGTITIHQQRKIVNLLKDFGMASARPVSTPLQPNVYLSRADCPKTPEERKGIDVSRYRSAVGALMHIIP